jgi:hypothetical protein
LTGPRPVEQADHAVIEDIEKTGQRRVVMIQFTVMNILGNMQWHGALGPEQTQEVYHETGLAGLLLTFKALERGGRKTQGGRLTKLNGVVRSAGRVAHTGFIREPAFHPSGDLIEAEPGRVLEEPQIYSVCLVPRFAGHRIISPRSRVLITVSVNELMETYFEKKTFITAPSRKTPVPSKAPSSNSRAISRPRTKAICPWSLIRRVMGLTVDRQHPFDLFSGLKIAGVTIQPEQVSNGR